MEIFNTTTNEVETLTYYDRCSQASQQQDSSADVTADDPCIKYNPNQDRYEASGEAIDYWRQWFDLAEKADDLECELRGLLKASGHDDPSEFIRENVNQHYFEHDTWPKQRMDLLSALKVEVLGERAK